MTPLFPVTLFACISLLMSTEAAGQSRKKINGSSNFTIEQIAPRVWVAVSNNHYGKAISNAGIIDLGNQTLVFDAFMTPEAARELKVIAHQLTKKKVTLVVNSHHHNDHIRGTQAFLPEASVISTHITRREIERVEPEEQEWEQKHAPVLLQAMKKRSANTASSGSEDLPFWIGYYEAIMESAEELEMVLPDLLFNDSMWIEGTKLSVKLVERRNGHTASDAVMLIPSLGIAFMGDLLCTDRHPWISDGNPDQWKQSLKLFYEDTLYHTYVPGYGKVSNKAALQTLYNYLDDLQALCRNIKTDAAETELMARPVPDAYKGWMCSRFYQPNLEYLINTRKVKVLEKHLKADSLIFR